MAGEATAAEVAGKNGDGPKQIKEGKATILAPKDGQVFYNPIQQYNRDLSVLAIKVYGEQALHDRQQRLDASGKSGKHGKKRKREGQDDGDRATKTQAQEAAPQDQQSSASNDESLKPQDQDMEDGRRPVASNTEPSAPLANQATTMDQPPTTSHDEPPMQSSPKPLSFKILDALSASGLRALRYAHELPFVTSVTANDLSKSAAESIQHNVEHNSLQDKVSVSNDDALAHMYRAIADDLSNRDRRGNPSKANKFDVIDLDPYGTAAPFIDAAVQAVRDDGGLLAITCTDSAIWAGHSYCEKAFALYGGTPVKGMHSHEAGLRLIINAVATSAARYGISIDPLLSLSIDYYTKVFLRVTKSPKAVKFHGSKSMLVYNCDQGCGAWQTQPLMKTKPTPNKKGGGVYYKYVMAQGPTADRHCQHCGNRMHVNGPMYGGRLHSVDFIKKLLAEVSAADPKVYGTKMRLEGMLQTALEELTLEPEMAQGVGPKEAELAALDPWPFYVVPARLASALSSTTPNSHMLRGALRHLGYRTARSHCRPAAIKTNAPWSTIWWVMTEWIRQQSPVKLRNIKETMPGFKILRDAGLTGQGEEQETAAATSGVAGAKVNEAEAELRKALVFDDDLERLGHQAADPKKLIRFQANPEPNWGPLAKAKK